jgi:hypothetical protein
MFVNQKAKSSLIYFFLLCRCHCPPPFAVDFSVSVSTAFGLQVLDLRVGCESKKGGYAICRKLFILLVKKRESLLEVQFV